MDQPKTNKEIIIIGGGIGGLGLAAMLGKQGHSVTVLEKNDKLGGRISTVEADGFMFDTGPTFYLMPDVFEQWFELMGEDINDHLELVKLDPSYKAWFKDVGTVVEIHSDLERDGKTIEALEPGALARLTAYLERSKTQYYIAKDRFMYKNYDSIFDFMTWEVMTEGRKLSVFSKMHTYVSRDFSNPELQKLLEYHLVFLGSSPYNTPALYNIMSHVDFNLGVFYPMGGMHEIIKAIVRIGEKYGVTYKTEAKVEKILVQDGRAVGVRLNGQEQKADIVVSNADIHHTETALLDKRYRSYSDRFWEKRVWAPSALILFLGVKGEIPSLVHHNFLLSKDWRQNFAEIFDDPKWPTDPSLYVCAASKTDPAVAPDGYENVYVLVPIAPGLSYTDEEINTYAERVLITMETEMDIPDLRERLVVKKRFCVKDFERLFYSPKGTALGLAHTISQTAIFRPDTRSKKIPNLFYVGGNTNPGIGMPTCLISAQLAYKRMIGDDSSGPLQAL